MQPNSAPDIYLMKREKSRAGCMMMMIVLLAALVLAAIFGIYNWHQNRDVEQAAPVEFPAAPVEADPPFVDLPEMPESPVPEPPPPIEQAAPQPAAPAPAPVLPPPGPVAEPLPAPSGDDAEALLARARERLQAGDYQAAREIGLEALAVRADDKATEAFLSELAMPLLASQRPMPEKVDYVVQSGDYLGKLAATFNTPVALIAKANHIQGATIRVGQSLRLLDGNQHRFAVQVSKSRNDLLLTLDGRFFKRYRVSTGENAKTPVGVYKITEKIAQPTWHKPGERPIPYGDPENLLGTHWLALDLPGYGLHGTWEPDSIGRQTSAGCIRLLNDEIEELYSILPKGTVVTITE
ncbi:MAG: L,D-transpeptidase family protein [Verrucomicrobiota bacterium]|jgi:lipoprotein-anchoring transpeptidase ErfK/SrfK|nr:L,D-transpeptidase family protein [Verrucomicrobiota bacterium]